MGQKKAKNHHVSFGKSRLARAALPFSAHLLLGEHLDQRLHHLGVGLQVRRLRLGERALRRYGVSRDGERGEQLPARRVPRRQLPGALAHALHQVVHAAGSAGSHHVTAQP